MIGVYANKDLEVKLERLKKWVEERVEGNESIDREDFNARTEREEGRVEEEHGGWRGQEKKVERYEN